MGKRELIFAAIIMLVLAAGDLFAFPMGLFLDIHIADVEPMYFTLMINQWMLIAAALIVIHFICPNLQLGLTKAGFSGGIKQYALSGLLIFALSLIAFYLGLKPFDNEPSVLKVLIEGFVYYVGVAFIEELYIRGILLNITETILRKGKYATVYAIIISSIIFGIGHIFGTLGSPLLTIICKVVWTIGLGVYLGAIYKKTNNLWVPIVLHAVIDFCAWPFCFSATPTYPEISLWILLIVYLGVGSYGCYIMFRKNK